MTQADQLQATVIENGYCIGCGACAALPNSAFRIALDTNGKLQASRQPGNDQQSYCAVCPFAAERTDETQLGSELFSDATNHPLIGRYHGVYAGWAHDESQRMKSASGGLGSLICRQLLQENIVDGVAHVIPATATNEDETILRYAISRSTEEIDRGRGSHYYPVEMSAVLQQIREQPGRYAVVGVPKFITAVRQLQQVDPIYRERIVFCIGLIAGHMKSKHYADMLAWERGIAPGNLTAINFRSKDRKTAANRFSSVVSGQRNGQPVSITFPVETSFHQNDWGLKLFEYKATEFSDDMMAETADIAIGDAWLPQYKKDARGTNIIIARSARADALLQSWQTDLLIQLESLTPDDIVQSQRSGLRHVRAGFAYRATQEPGWHPKPRPSITENCPAALEQMFAERSHIAEASFTAWNEAQAANNFTVFTEKMKPLIQQYYASRPWWYKYARRIRNAMWWLQRTFRRN